MKLNKIATAIATVTMAAGFALPAQADVLAQSVLELSNFRFTDANGATLNATQFDQLVFNDSTDIAATLNGVTATYSQNNSGFGGIDGVHQIVGGPNPGENNYAHVMLPTTDRARGDTLLNGAPLAGTGFASGADAHTLAEAQLINAGTGSAQDNLGLLATVSFSLTQGQAVGVAFDIDQFLKALVTAGSAFGSSAQASSGWSINLSDSTGNTLFDWTPDGVLNSSIVGGVEIEDDCDMTRTLGAQIPGQNAQYNCQGSANALTSFTLDASQFYTLNLRHESTADASLGASRIPEPATLGLLGLGLVGMGAVARRKSKV